MTYRHVLFDAGGTLIGPRTSFGAVYARVLAPLGLPSDPGAWEAALRASWDQVTRNHPPGTDRYGAAPGGESGFWLACVRSTLAQAAGPGAERLAGEVLEPLRRAFADPEAWDVYPDVLPALESLRRGGVKLAIVSNWDSRLPALLRRLGLAPYFAARAVSAEEGCEKPDPRLFRRALERLGARPETTLHVGDLPEIDAAGARAAGLDAVLVDRSGRLDPSWRAVRDLSSLPERAGIR